jgi:DNA-binding CsgD family transcriptional regulator
MVGTGRTAQSSTWVRGYVAIALVELIMFAHDDFLLPLASRDVLNLSVFVSGLIYVPVALAAYWRPRLLRTELIGKVTLVAGLAGCVLYRMLASQSVASTGLFLTADFLLNCARAWLTVSAVLCLAEEPDAMRCVLCTTLSLGLAYAIWAFIRPAVEVAPDIYSACLLVILWLFTHRSIQQGEDAATKEGSLPPATLAPANPFSFIPLASHFYGCIFVFETTFGFQSSITFQVATSAQYAAYAIGLFAIAAFAYVLAWRHAETPYMDLFTLCTLINILGLQLVTARGLPFATPSIILSIGGQGFYALMLSILANSAARNPAGRFVVVPCGLAISTCASCVGFAIADFVAGSGYSSTVALFVSSGLVTLLVGYDLIAMRTFNFDETLRNITPVRTPEVPTEAAGGKDGATAEDALFDAIAADAALTAREREIARMLSQGRNAPYIEEKLVISRATVKTHIRHIYQKLDIHSQQELIDLFSGVRSR